MIDWPGMRNTASSVISDSTFSTSPALLAVIQVVTSCRMSSSSVWIRFLSLSPPVGNPVVLHLGAKPALPTSTLAKYRSAGIRNARKIKRKAGEGSVERTLKNDHSVQAFPWLTYGRAGSGIEGPHFAEQSPVRFPSTFMVTERPSPDVGVAVRATEKAVPETVPSTWVLANDPTTS